MNGTTKTEKKLWWWRSGILVIFCLMFLGGIKAEKAIRPSVKQEQAGFAMAVIATESPAVQNRWRKVVLKNPELIIRAVASESRF